MKQIGEVKLLGYYLALLLVAAMVVSLASCRSKQQPVVVSSIETERVVSVESVRFDTVMVEIRVPAQSVEVTVKDTMSRLETDFAWSEARINADGSLYHGLFNKTQTLTGDAVVPVKDKQSVTDRQSVKEVPVYVSEPYEVEKKLSWWQNFRLNSFWWMIAVISGLIIFIFRKKIFIMLGKLI